MPLLVLINYSAGRLNSEVGASPAILVATYSAACGTFVRWSYYLSDFLHLGGAALAVHYLVRA